MNQQYQYRPNFNFQRNSSNYLRQVSDDNNLYSSSEGFTLGNMFKDSYIPYKNYTPQVLTPTSEQDDLFLRLSEQEFAAHDLNLYLDLNPQDGNMLEIFNQYRKEANNLLNEYEARYGVINISSEALKDSPFKWEMENFPWNEGGMYMWKYQKKLQYPINLKRKDLNMAKLLVEQYGGSNGELSAALRYLNQRYTMPDNKGQALLTDIGSEELAHIEMISTMIYQLLKDATIEELKAAGLDSHYAGHKRALYPTNADGVPFTVDYFATTGDPLADLAEDMAAEQKARAVYENLIDLTNDPDVIGPLLFLRQREVVHYNLFKALFDEYQKKYR